MLDLNLGAGKRRNCWYVFFSIDAIYIFQSKLNTSEANRNFIEIKTSEFQILKQTFLMNAGINVCFRKIYYYHPRNFIVHLL